MNGIVINELKQEENSLISTAIDDHSMKTIQDGDIILHLFQHSGINMGNDDTKIKDFKQGLEYYYQNNIPVTIRNAGGRSVVSDDGVLNMSLIVKNNKNMYENFAYLDQFIKDALRPITQDIKTGLIDGAYCPGQSDMSIDGKKFSGTAQRKRKDVSALVCYIGVNGDQHARGELVKGFYDSMQEHDIIIDPHAMGTLSSLIGREFTVQEIGDLMIEELKRRTDTFTYTEAVDTTTDSFKASLESTLKRNQ